MIEGRVRGNSGQESKLNTKAMGVNETSRIFITREIETGQSERR